MIMPWVAVGLALLAGMTVQRQLIDRLWPAPVHTPQHAPTAAAVPKTPARRQLEFEDTMDVIGAAYSAGQQARSWDDRIRPRLELNHDDYQVPPWPGDSLIDEQMPAGGGL